MINHHLTEATLVSYAAGTLGDAMSLVVASHLSLCGDCRARLRVAREAGGVLLEEADAAPLAPDALDSIMARLDRPAADRDEASPRERARPRDIRLPRPLAERLAVGHLDEIGWRWLAPGVRTHVIAGPRDGGTLRLLRLAPGRAMPEHGHGGSELTLVLSGAYGDVTGIYGPGDIADLDEEIEHSPVVEPGEDCICLVATEAPTRFKGLMGRVMQPYLGF